MIAKVITETSITFIARKRPWILAKDHPQFKMVRDALLAGEEDEEKLISLTDVRMAINFITGGLVRLEAHGLFLRDKPLAYGWEQLARSEPAALQSLLVQKTDKVRIEGDPDAPDGVYEVGDVDDEDYVRRIFVDSGDGFIGYVSNRSIKGIVKELS